MTHQDMDAATGVLHDSEAVQPGQVDRVSVKEIARQDPGRLNAQELSPARSGSSRGWIDAGVLQDSSDRGSSQVPAQAGQLPGDSPVTPRGILRGQAQHQRVGRRFGRRATRRLVLVGPAALHQCMPAQQRVRCHQQPDRARMLRLQTRASEVIQQVRSLITRPRHCAARSVTRHAPALILLRRCGDRYGQETGSYGAALARHLRGPTGNLASELVRHPRTSRACTWTKYKHTGRRPLSQVSALTAAASAVRAGTSGRGRRGPQRHHRRVTTTATTHTSSRRGASHGVYSRWTR